MLWAWLALLAAGFSALVCLGYGAVALLPKVRGANFVRAAGLSAAGGATAVLSVITAVQALS